MEKRKNFVLAGIILFGTDGVKIIINRQPLCFSIYFSDLRLL